MDLMRKMLRRSLLRQISEISGSGRYGSNSPRVPESETTITTQESVNVVKERIPRIGDDGYSVTLKGLVKPKDDIIFRAIGSCNELCSFIGLAREYAHEDSHPYVEYLKRIQTLLIDISVAVSNSSHNAPSENPVTATVSPSPLSTKGTAFSKRHVAELEEWIEEYSESLPPVEHFVIPGGGKVCALLHVALSVCRRTEREIVPLVHNGDLDKEALVYLNRLAEFLFIVSRVAAMTDEKIETVYTPKPSRSS